MRLRSLILSLLLLSPPLVHAQGADTEVLDNLTGLESAIARAWTAPIVYQSVETNPMFDEQGTPISVEVVTSTTNEQGTPIASPMASPPPEGGIAMIMVTIFAFDSAANASLGMTSLEAETQHTLSRDPRTPTMRDLSLSGLGDAASGVTGLVDGDPPHDVTFAYVQNGALVYSILAMTIQIDSEVLVNDTSGQLIDAPVGTDAERFSPDGTSTGGLWEKLNTVNLDLAPDSTIMDAVIWPIDENATQGQTVNVPVVDLDALDEAPGIIESAHQAYGSAIATPVASPTASDTPYAIDVWILTAMDPQTAGLYANSLASTIAEPITIIGTGTQFFEQADSTSWEFSFTGYVRDRSLPAGDAAIIVVQDGDTIIAVRVLGGEGDPLETASAIVEQIRGTDASDPLADRLPVEGDPALEGLAPVD